MSNSNPIQNSVDQLNNWAEKYQNAVDNGVFDTPEKKHMPSPYSSDYESFFGMQNTGQSDSIRDVDANYWNMVYKTADYSGDPMQLIAEANTKKEKEGIAKTAKKMADSPNPVRAGGIGPDQDSEQSMSDTWTVEELNKLHDLKIQLHDLSSKIASLDGTSYDSKYESLKNKIDDLSNSLDGNFPKSD